MALIVVALVAGACSGSDSADPTTPTAETAAAGTTLAASVSGAAATAEEARDAVVQIIAEGSFVDPFEGVQANVPGSGSGFIIDDSGLAVTNNHVVTGAGLLRVYVADEVRNARVVGVSECSDLAVIDIDGEGFPYLEWYGDDIAAGLEIYAAGFPLGDAEYTLLDGIVSKEDADGETTWASVDAVIEHSADTLPGNSGGPIITLEGKIVGVNYAGNEAGQSFAIGKEVASPLVDRLGAGENVNSIGVNGEAFFGSEFSGIWVYSVQSGSPADRAGIQPGDLLLRLEGLDLALDGTMSDYCDILRSHSPDDVLTVEVYRSTTDEILEGQLNGRVLEPIFSFAGELEGVAPVEPPTDGGPPPYADFMLVSDDSGAITVNVPTEWADSVQIPWDFGGQLVGPALSAAPNVDLFITTWGTPGVFIGASDQLPMSRAQLLDESTFFEDCDYVDRFDYDDGLYVGEFDFWENCGVEGSDFIVVAAEPVGGGFTVLVEIIIVDERDFDAADEVIATFVVGGDLGVGVAPPPEAAPPVAPPPAGGIELASGLLCRDLSDMGFGYYEAVGYWIREGHPTRMDADGNGIPCETVFPLAEVDGFYALVLLEADGLFCRDFFDFGSFYSDAVAYWILWGFPDRMDADLNGIPCETVYPYEEYDPFLYFEYYIG
jgi:serine protease Do